MELKELMFCTEYSFIASFLFANLKGIAFSQGL